MFDLDLTYKVQTEPGGIAQVVGHGRGLRRRRQARASASATTCSSSRRSTRSAGGSRTEREPRSSSRRCPTPSASASSSTARTGRVSDVVEKAGVVDTRFESPPTSDAVVGLYCYDAGRLRADPRTASLEPRRARDHRRQPCVRGAGSARRPPRPGLVARRGHARSALASSVRSSRRPGRTSPHERRRGDPAQAVRGRARLVRRARARVPAAEAVGADERLVLARRA